ncbi:flagellar basal body P-ring formation chaperone FlgA [Candidatus Margulisiibacteriota bacterium]
MKHGFTRMLLAGLLGLVLAVSVSALNNPEAELNKVIEDYIITQQPNLAGLEIRVTFKYADRIFDSLRGLSGEPEFRIVQTDKDFKPVGNVIFPIEVTSGQTARKIFIRAKVEVFKDIVVAKKRIKRGQTIGQADLSLEARDIAMLPQKYFAKLDNVIGSETKTNIPKNSTLYEWMVKEVPLVRRGDTLAVLVKAPNLLIKTQGQALSDGYLNKKMKVKREDSKTAIEGILISAKEVEVNLK